MSETVLISVVGVLGTLLGAAVTSLVSVYSNLKTKQLEAKNSFVMTRLQSKEATYNEFIAELHYRSLTTFHGQKTEKDRLPRLMDLASKIQMYSEELGQCADELVEIIYSMEHLVHMAQSIWNRELVLLTSEMNLFSFAVTTLSVRILN
ncbi:hypothetical protein QNE93_004024 [Vibrio vulnificus]|uniref:hypothetical protein n=1 Tax=Vibrio vulnificus TaxID=672 RepID=UPI002879FF20|nr:hypothetical protein [Vibrio vulnificus]EJT1341224.1 hypothetical protein [Vibrio vulnificus]ELV8746763.1 hypothetical protein [Vibrio vulnificus]ELV8755122.1 hypothetical protein [Vibrio vulnificus]MDS1829108.1 hypothetical protein [Vibrio vulnificus]